MKRMLMLAAVAALGACGGGDPGTVHSVPAVQLVAPAENSTISGTVTVTLKAIGDGTTIRSFVFTAPSALAGVTPTIDDATHSATLTADLDSNAYPNGILTLQVKATDSDGYDAAAEFNFLVNAQAHAASIDAAYASFYDEGGVQLVQSGGVAVVDSTSGASLGQYDYASGSKVVVKDGTSLRRIVSRAWRGATPAAAVLNANPYNVPTMRILVPHAGTDPAITSAKGFVTVGTGTQVTFDLVPDSSSPAGQAAFLLPLASPLIPDLARMTAANDLKVSVEVKDAYQHAAVGGPWTVHVTPMAPPVVVTVDTGYASVADSRSAYAYNAQNYLTLWNSPSNFALDNGVRVFHVVVTNPENHPVSLGAALGGANAWSISETWRPHLAAQSAWTTCTQTCSSGGSGTPTCSSYCQGAHNSVPKACGGTSTPVCYQETNSTSWSCVAASYDSGPTSGLTRSGALKLTAYKSGTTSAADLTANRRYLVPASTGNNPGRVDLYVVRPLVTDRSGAPAATWASELAAYRTAVAYHDVNLATCSFQQYTSSSCTYYDKSWDQLMSGATETLSGTVAMDSQAYDDAQPAEVGLVAPALAAQTLPTTITH